MSSALSSTGEPTSTTTPSPSPSASQSSSNSNMASANYFFGFVITFVVLLLVFVACGIGSRRRFAFIGTAWDRNAERSRRTVEKPCPSFWETWLKPTDNFGSGDWSAIQPISALFTRQKITSKVEDESHPQPRMYGGLASGFVIPEGGRWRTKPKAPERSASPPEALQIAVMLAMPSPSRSFCHPPNEGPSHRAEELVHTGGAQGEYQIGITSVPWVHGEVDF
ncbi:hypothetical protein BV22DRAFT_1126424 [Leucogyrophana mollusca]|uniref:Uncharacterized protein n=1 Tax=Leucogyrophana mollusca TaxID=85980 RepID=A0ACB8BRM9_9AGAM|nr:hypothetical protein BV22DRAFT_1126424 [Leucogyrophana mollusca]